jgi:hypothetical protein
MFVILVQLATADCAVDFAIWTPRTLTSLLYGMFITVLVMPTVMAWDFAMFNFALVACSLVRITSQLPRFLLVQSLGL